jgi:prephenate dehydrogenase
MTLGRGRVAVVGTGLIGASVGLAAKRAGVERVAGFDPHPGALSVAVELGAVDSPAGSIREAVEAAELVVVAAPVGAISACVAEALASTDHGATVTDVGSAKARICSAHAAESRFVGGHPLAGSERHGPQHASADLFVGSTWFLTPLAGTDKARRRQIRGFVSRLGAKPVEIDPIAHDQLVALTSHLPHALANLLVNQVGGASVAGHDALATAGASFREMTRVAGANPGIWVDIFLENAGAIGAALAEHRRLVEELEELLRRGDRDALSGWIEEAAGKRLA